MIYRGPGSYNSANRPPLAPHHLPSATCLSFSVFLSSLLTGEGGGGGRGAKSYDREKAWPSINHSVLSAYMSPTQVAS